MNSKNITQLMATLFASSLLVACGGGGSGSSDTPTNPDTTDTSMYNDLDATNPGTATKMDLNSGHTVTDDSWQIAYQKYIGFKTNGGESGTGQVEGCVAHEYKDLYERDSDGKLVLDNQGKPKPIKSEFEALNKENTLANFAAVKKSSCTDMMKDTLKTQIVTESWLDYDRSQGAPVFSAKAGNAYIIRSSAGDGYARVKVKDVNVSLTAPPTTQITLSVEKWNADASAFDAAVDSPVLDFSRNRVFYDFDTNAVVTASDGWDLSIKNDLEGRDFPMQVNGGASGDGKGGLGVLVLASADDVRDPTDTAQVYKYFGDTVEGVLSKPGDYGPFQYSVAGQHKMWPTFTTYLIKDGENYYKMQVISNYGKDGTLPSGNLHIRHEAVTE